MTGSLNLNRMANVFRPKNKWNPEERTDIIIFDESSNMEDLNKKLRLGKHVTPEKRIEITNMIKKFWYCFSLKGCHRTIIGYKFSIDTGIHIPVCWRKPSYGFHEAKIILSQITTLLSNKWIRKCGVP